VNVEQNRKLRRIFETSDSVAGLKVEKLEGVVSGAGERGDVVVERAPRDRRSLDILSVKKEAKLSASEVNDVEVGGVQLVNKQVSKK